MANSTPKKALSCQPLSLRVHEWVLLYLVRRIMREISNERHFSRARSLWTFKLQNRFAHLNWETENPSRLPGIAQQWHCQTPNLHWVNAQTELPTCRSDWSFTATRPVPRGKIAFMPKSLLGHFGTLLLTWPFQASVGLVSFSSWQTGLSTKVPAQVATIDLLWFAPSRRSWKHRKTPCSGWET